MAFDCAIGRGVGQALALGALYGLATEKDAAISVAALSVTGSGLDGAAFCEAVARFYNKAYLRDFPERFQRYRGLPIGMAEAHPAPAPSAPLEAVLALKGADGEPEFPQEVHEVTDTADPAALLRNALTAEEDGNAAVVLAGPATSLAAVLALNGGRELIGRKVRRLVAALGDLPSEAPDEMLAADVAAARKLFRDWPTPIVLIGRATGEQARYPAASVEADFTWAEKHPVAEAYKAFGKMPYDAPTQAAAAVLEAGRPDSPYFELSEPGEAEVGDDGSLRFRPTPDGRVRFATLRAGQQEALVAAFRAVIPAMPAARELPSFLKKIVDDEKKDDEKKQEEAKPPAAKP